MINPTQLAAALLLCACAAVQAQTASSPAKKELVQKLLALQQPGIEGAARGVVERPAVQMMQEAGRVLQTQIPADKREAIGSAIQADVKKYVEEAYPPVRERAVKLAPTTIGPILEEKFTEDETQSVLTATENGYGKRTPIAEYTRHGRGTKGMIAIQQSERNGKVVAATLVHADDEIMLITDTGVLVRTRVAEIRELGRATQGVTLISLDEGAKLSGLQRIVENDANESATDGDDAGEAEAAE